MAKGRNKLLEFLEIEVKGVYNLIKSGELSFARIGRQWGALQSLSKKWRECVRIELTKDGNAAPRLVLKTRGTTRHQSPP